MSNGHGGPGGPEHGHPDGGALEHDWHDAERGYLMFANAKRTYDAYQGHHLEAVGRDRVHFDSLMTAEREHTAELRRLSLQALQNAIETSNMVGKQASRHSDVAIDRQWNVDEQGYTVADILQSNTFKDAVASGNVQAAASAVADILAAAKD